MGIDRTFKDLDESGEAALHKKREQRIREFMRDALNHADPLQALVRATSGDLMETSGKLKEAIEQAFREEPDLRRAFADVSPLLEVYLKYQRQFDRFVQLDQRLQTPPATTIVNSKLESVETAETVATIEPNEETEN